MPLRRLWVTILLCDLMAAATIEKVAGGGKAGYGEPANEIAINQPFGLAFDKAGNCYFTESRSEKLVKVDTRGIGSIFAGTGQKGYGGDGGPAIQALIGFPHTISIGRDAQLYLADTANNRVRKIDLKTGIITTVAGTGEKGYSGDGGPATEAVFSGILAASLSPSGERLYIPDGDNKRLRMVNLKTGIVTTIAGNGKEGVPQDGAKAVDSPLLNPRAAAEDSKGNVYIVERKGNAFRVIDKQGRIRTILGPSMKPELKEPKDVHIDRSDNVIIADSTNNLIRKYTPADEKTIVIAGTGEAGDRIVPNDPLKTQLNQPHAVYVHPSGDIYIADSYNNRVLRLKE
jgi:sugar lactone lactonase YvrE